MSQLFTKQRKICLFGFTPILIFFLFIGSAYTYEVEEIIKRSKRVTKGLKKVRLKEKSVTGSVNITYSEGAMNYIKNEFLITEKTDSTILRSIYLKNNETYLYDGIFQDWIKFNEPVDFFAKPFNKDIWFSAFPPRPKELGLKLELLGEEIVEGRNCYIVRSSVIDKEKAKFYIDKFLRKFFPAALISMLEGDQEFLDSFLDTYVRDLETTLWISKKTFFVVKILNSYYQMPGEGESIFIKNESVFYDFNKPVTIIIPPDAASATEVNIRDLAPKF